MLAPFALLVVAQLVGEVLCRALHLPLPGPVIGMLLLTLLLVAKRDWLGADPEHPSELSKTATGLINNMGLLFIPAGVGIVAQVDVLRHEWLPILAGLLVSTTLGLMVTATVMNQLGNGREVDVESVDGPRTERKP